MLPELDVPEVPDVPELLPEVPEVPDVPDVPLVPVPLVEPALEPLLPEVPELPDVPDVPDVPLPEVPLDVPEPLVPEPMLPLPEEPEPLVPEVPEPPDVPELLEPVPLVLPELPDASVSRLPFLSQPLCWPGLRPVLMPREVSGALPEWPGVTSKRSRLVLELPPTADEPGLVVSPLVEEPTPGLVLDPGVVVLELLPDWPAAGAPEASLLPELEPLFKPLDWPVELLLVSEPYWPVPLRELPLCDWLEAGAPDSREPELLEPDPMDEPELPLELVPLL